MISGEYKKSLLKRVEKFNIDIFKNEGGPGSSNIRSVSNICERADCYEELRLYIEYKISKGNGWNFKFDGKQVFGQAVLKDMDEIYNESEKDDYESIKRIQLYFGYIYWIKSSAKQLTYPTNNPRGYRNNAQKRNQNRGGW